MTTLDLRGSNSTLRLSANTGAATIRPYIGVGAKGDTGSPGTNGSPGAGASGAYPNLARTPEMLIVGTITRDSNGLATSAPVKWPDGTVGTYTALTFNADPPAVNSYKITYGSPVTNTYTQPAVTRNSDGVATNVPAIVVS